ncbi:MAG: SH3 domain-containing protein [Parvibaculum sp.]
MRSQRYNHFALSVLSLLCLVAQPILFSTGASGAALPASYNVTQVAADDVLNVRSRPDHLAPVTGTLPPNATGIELTGKTTLVKDATWVEIRHNDLTGWVNSHYLAPLTTPSSPSAPIVENAGPDMLTPDMTEPAPARTEPKTSHFREPLSCSGTEPFWGLEVKGMAGALDTLSDGRSDIRFETIRNADGSPIIWSFRGQDVRTGKPVLAVLEETGQCNDGMSDLAYKYSIRLDIKDGPFFAGCCNRLPGQPDP